MTVLAVQSNNMKNNFYHILNRGVEKRKIFLNEKDYFRFLHNMEDFNDKNTIIESYYRRRIKYVGTASTDKNKNKMIKTTNYLVNTLCWCLMPNHFHILVKEIIDKGASLFSMKNTAGYTRYFNEINKRSGVLFQGRTKILLVERDEHFLWLSFYILANPLDLFQLDWREKGVKNPKDAFNFLLNYKWSNFSKLFDGTRSTENNIFYETFNITEKQFKKDFEDWLINYKGGYNLRNFEN